jgi:translocator protein
MKTDLWKLIAAILVCQLAGAIGSIFTLQSIPTWYASLTKPAFSPPNWVFGPVWILLYALMGVSAYWIYTSKDKRAKAALCVFGLQLVLNTLWSIAFFGLRSPLYGLALIVLLWLSIVATIVKFHEINKKAGLILIPYIIWVSFALILNLFIWRLN